MAQIRQKWQVAAVMMGAFVLLSATVLVRGKFAAPTTSYNEQLKMARYLLHGTGFVCPVGPERNDPSSWYSPGYIALMSAIMAGFGEDSAVSLAAIRLANITAMSVAIGLYFLLGLRQFGPKVAWLTVALILLSPSLLFKADEIWDTSWALLGGAFLLVLFVTVKLKNPLALLGSGLACGGVAMINPCFTLCYPVWVVYSWWTQRKPGQKAISLLRHSTIVLIGFVIAILPWTIRNYLTFGELFYLRGNLPLELWSGNASWSDGYGDAVQGNKPHPVFHESETQRMTELGEYGYFKACREDVARWWKQDKTRFVHLTLRRMGWFWFGRYDFDLSPSRLLLKIIGVAISSMAGILGALVVVWKRREGLVLIATLLLFPIPYYVTQIMVRYRLPIEPVILLLAAIGLAELWTAKKHPLTKNSLRSLSEHNNPPLNPTADYH